MAAANCSLAVASRRAKYVDDFRVPTLFGAQSRPHFLKKRRRTTAFLMAVPDHTQLVQRKSW
jgi:hypothetical protein